MRSTLQFYGIDLYDSTKHQATLRIPLHCIVIDVISFIAATKMILEGNVSVAFARDTVM